MAKIHQLSHEIVSKIAAGEVIERPVFAVKELIENSIDAGSNSISIFIEESGRNKITVIDNGEGMSKEDLQLCTNFHTTSKISKLEELSHISTLGFRGEALASIAAISHLTINSKVASEITGTQIVVKNGFVEKLSSIGMPTGTSVSVNKLFYSLPVRKKFLKSARTEFRQILDTIVGYALSFPRIHFLLTHNKKTILDLPISPDSIQRIEKLLGKGISSSIIPLSYEDAYISLSGFISKPELSTSIPNKLYIFVNYRPVTDKGITSAIKSAYGSLLSGTSYPICLLQISIPFEMVDVNVHPRKEIIRFADSLMLTTALKRAVNTALTKYDLTPDTLISSLFLNDGKSVTDSYAGRILKDKILPWKLSQAILPDKSEIIVMNNLYIIVVSKSGFSILDQHAAHERILYEQYLHEFNKEKNLRDTIQLHKPEIVELSIIESTILTENLSYIQKFGWEIDFFKDTTFIIRRIPLLFQDRNIMKLIKELLEDMQNEINMKNADTLTKTMIAFLACRSAIKAGDRISKKQALELVDQLNNTPNNVSCPHGRPTKMSIDIDKIHRLFKRFPK